MEKRRFAEEKRRLEEEKLRRFAEENLRQQLLLGEREKALQPDATPLQIAIEAAQAYNSGGAGVHVFGGARLTLRANKVSASAGAGVRVDGAWARLDGNVVCDGDDCGAPSTPIWPDSHPHRTGMKYPVRDSLTSMSAEIQSVQIEQA